MSAFIRDDPPAQGPEARPETRAPRRGVLVTLWRLLTRDHEPQPDAQLSDEDLDNAW